MNEHRHSCEPLGVDGVARLLGWTVDYTRQVVHVRRGRTGFPVADWRAGGRPLWCRHTVLAWHRGRAEARARARNDPAREVELARDRRYGAKASERQKQARRDLREWLEERSAY